MKKTFLKIYLVILGFLIALLWILAFTQDTKKFDVKTLLLICSIFTVVYFLVMRLVISMIKDIEYNKEKEELSDHFK